MSSLTPEQASPPVTEQPEAISLGGRIGIYLLLFTAFLIATVELGRFVARLLAP
jgi:hypothetical protein